MLRVLALIATICLSSSGFAAEAPTSDPCSNERILLAHGGSFARASDGTRIWYKVAGREGAPVIAYLHGGPGYNSFTFEKSVGPLLEKEFRVLYLDERGCGRSGLDGARQRHGMRPTVDDVELLRTLIGAEQIVLAGHSFGGAVAAEYAALYPSRVAAIIMIDTLHDLARALQYQVEYIASIGEEAFPDQARGIQEVARSSTSAIEKLAKMYGLVGSLPLQRRLHFAEPANQQRMEALDRDSGFLNCTPGKVVDAFTDEGYLTKPMPNVMRRLSAPTLLIAGRQSHVIGATNILAAADAWGARVVWLDAGHFVYLERPQEFVAAVQTFLRNVQIE